ncbi:M23 family metallopeptidase [Calorimonas adulescens]|uniref:Peptidoglycan DD-metalloendopeptidase family protein n=1 Tax=Calorimonas adulescens TaxID=2606906 RepID=A0A5D8QGB6_9THEO|nr:M23 family metallopeptidase [Calorimonas adulescens]TZE83595.1 peptidoglycan DD-metalloendopeptidase family protein [Calorimonas adulescens]
MERNRYFTIILIPHSTGKPLSIRIPLYVIWATLVTVLSIIIYSLFLTNSYIEVNNKKESLSAQVINLEKEKRQKESEISTYEIEINQISEYLKNLKALEAEVQQKVGLEQSTPSRNNLDRIRLLESQDGVSNDDIIDEIKGIIEEYQNLLKDIEEREKYLRNVPNLYPVNGKASSGYGNRINPITRSWEFHSGLDICADYGSTVKAACDGVVSFTGIKSGYGQTVIIKNSYGFTTLYGHNSRLLVKEGQKVKKGDPIAKVGSSGLSTGPHVHFEVYKNGVRVDPLKYLMGGE